MTVISDGKKPNDQMSGMLANELMDNNSNQIIDANNQTTETIADIVDRNDEDEFDFPVVAKRRLIDAVNKSRWVVPVLPGDDLEKILLFTIKCAFKKKDLEMEEFKDVYKFGFLVSFEKIFMDDAVLGWKADILDSIYRSAVIMMKLCAMKIVDDNECILDILSLVFNPDSKYHQCPCNNYSSVIFYRVDLLEDFCQLIRDNNESFNSPETIEEPESDAELPPVSEYKYAFTNDNRRCKIIYVDIINIFGHFDGFANINERLQRFRSLDIPDLSSNLTILLGLLRPVALSIDFLTPYTLTEFVTPITEKAMVLILSVDKDIIKQESIKEWKGDKFSHIINFLEIILRKTNADHDYINQLSLFRLNIILKILQHSSFNGRMNALNELNKLIKSIYSSLYQPNINDRLTHIVHWIKENDVLSIALKENLHQPQYVEKVEKLIRFMVKENGLTDDDLDRLWDSQIGKHDAIVTNIHDLLAKLAYDFNAAQLHHLFGCFQKSWTNASKKQRERLIDLIRRLAEEDKEGRMAKEALDLLWDLATQDDSPLDILDSALCAHAKILDFSCIQDRDKHRNEWLINLLKFLSNTNNQRNAVPALRQIREIVKLFQPVFNLGKCVDRLLVIRQLETDHSILSLVTHNLVNYVNSCRTYQTDSLDEKFPHDVNIEERLNTLTFFLYDGSLTLNKELLTNIWMALVVPSDSDDTNPNPDRDHCFRWLLGITENGWSLFDNGVVEDFFENQFLTLDPKLLTLNGISLFEQLFGMINLKKGFIRGGYLNDYVTTRMDLVGIDYIWRCAMLCFDEAVFSKVLNMLRLITTNLSTNLLLEKKNINEEFIKHCTLILSSAFNAAKAYIEDCEQICSRIDIVQENYYEVSPEMAESINKLNNIIQILCEFVRECDNRFIHERTVPSLCRMCYGQRLVLSVNCTNTGVLNNELNHTEVSTHSNELFGNLRRILEAKFLENVNDDYNLEISKGNGVVIVEKDDYKTLAQLDINNGTLLHTRLMTTFRPKFNCHTTNVDDAEIDIEDAENSLPGVMISKHQDYMDLIVNIGDLSLIINSEKLRWSIQHLLNMLPPDQHLVDEIRMITTTNNNEQLREMLLNRSAMQIIYTVNVIYSLLLPCNNVKGTDESILLLKYLVVSDCLEILFDIVHFDRKPIASMFVPRVCETSSIRLIGLIRLMEIIYVLLAVLGGINRYKNRAETVKFRRLHIILKDEAEHCSLPYYVIDQKMKQLIMDDELCLKVSPKCLPQRKDVDSLMKLSWCCAIGNKLEFMSNDIKKFHEMCLEKNLFERSGSTVVSVLSDSTVNGDIGPPRNENANFELATRPTFATLECLSMALACSNDTNILDLIKEKYTKEFITVLLLHTSSGHIRRKSAEELRLILGFSDSCKAIEHVIQMLFTKLHNVSDNPVQYGDVFYLVVKLLNDTHKMGSQLFNTEALFKCQLDRLLEMKRLPDNASNAARQTHDVLLIGRLRIINELVRFFTPQVKTSQNKRNNLINILLNSFLFPSSKRYSDISAYQHELQGDLQSSYLGSNRELPPWATEPLMNPICNTLESQKSAFELIKSLIAGSCTNMEILCDRIIALFYQDHQPMCIEWDYKPSFVSRSLTGFVGLKNAGATCYMNSVLQQLFMVAPIRQALLSVDAGPPITRDDLEDNILFNVRKEPVKRSTDPNSLKLDILREVQMIFGNLAFSQNQYFTPTGFWKHFKLWGDDINIREQHDAVEFFNCLVDTVDEGLHTIKIPKIFEEVLGGTFADQKICKGCPHHYESEDKFTTLSVDVHHHENLLESLEFYVKGDLLEGDNAYYCSSCKEKRDTVKRVCIKKLPLVLAIQLKRFDYDWERDISVKFNDYFEFPNELDMAPYTVFGNTQNDSVTLLNKTSRSPSLSSTDSEKPEVIDRSECSGNSTRYTLKGVVVHSGQASGGHYYSYIRERRQFNGSLGYCWYRFDDTEVAECKMDSEEMKNQWFGGDFMGESYDHVVKRMSLRRQKRWWSAYILFYEREDYSDHAVLTELLQAVRNTSTNGNDDTPSPMDGNNMFNIARLPRHIEENITLQNIQYMHTKNQYTQEYFAFLRDLPRIVTLNKELLPVMDHKLETEVADTEKMRVVVARLLSKFLFTTGFRTNRSIRGPANEWFESLKFILQPSEKARLEFCTHSFFYPLSKITEYLLESPNAEIREVCANLIKYISHWSMRNSVPGYCTADFLTDMYLKELYIFVRERLCTNEKVKLSHILMAIMLVLLNKDTNEYGSSCTEFMSFFYDYPQFGYPELNHCFDVNLPTHILKYCLDDYYPNSSQHCVDVNKLICSFCQMMRCYDLQTMCSDLKLDMIVPSRLVLQQTYPTDAPDIPISSIDNPCYFSMNSKPIWQLRSIPDHLHRYLFTRTNKFIKRIIDDFYNEYTKDDLILFLKYLCFDNFLCSEIIIGTMCYELERLTIKNARFFLDLFRCVFDVDDSLKVRRAQYMIQGEQLDVALRFQHGSERRYYYVIKMILFSIGKLNELEKKQLWEEIPNPQQTYDKLHRIIDNLKNTIQKSMLICDVESNEDNTSNIMERTNSTDELEKIGVDMMQLFITDNSPSDSEFDHCILAPDDVTVNINNNSPQTNEPTATDHHSTDHIPHPSDNQNLDTDCACLPSSEHQ